MVTIPLHPFWDKHQLLPGDQIHRAVDEAVRLWDTVLLWCSEASLQSWWVDKEFQKALMKEEQLWMGREEREIRIKNTITSRTASTPYPAFPMDLLVADARRLILFKTKEVRAMLPRLLKFRSSRREELVLGDVFPFEAERTPGTIGLEVCLGLRAPLEAVRSPGFQTSDGPLGVNPLALACKSLYNPSR